MNDFSGDWQHLLTEQERAWMLDDIARVSLAVGRSLFPDQIHDDLDISAHSLAACKSPVERLGFIERLLPELTQAVHQIQASPLTHISWEKRRVSPPMRARKVEARAILNAVRQGHAERFWEEQVTTWTPDTPENRAVKSFVGTLRHDAATIGAIADVSEENAIAQNAQNAARRLRHLEMLPVWQGIAKDTQAWRIPPTHRTLTDTRYAQIAQAMRHYQKSFQFDWTHPFFALPARETWRLYEAWGLFQVLEALLALGYRPSGDSKEISANALFAVHQDRLQFALVQGTESRINLIAPQERRVSLFYNRVYPQATQSLSHTMQPDIVVQHGNGSAWVLDTKFKSYAVPGSEGDDINQMHAYRDAIIDARGKRTVTRAWCLFCGGPENDDRSLIAYGCPTESLVGALRLHPGSAQSFHGLCQLLRDWEG